MASFARVLSEAPNHIYADDYLSFDNLEGRARCGFNPCALQIRRTVMWLTPITLAISRALQRVEPSGLVVSVACRISFILSGP